MLLFFLFSSQVNVQGQIVDPTTLTQNIDMIIDDLGDAKMELTMKMDASQWNAYINSEYAKNQSIFRRDLEREMMWVLIDDIEMKLDDKTREAKATLSVKNIASYMGDNRWTLRLGSKDINVTKISDKCYLMTNNIVSDNGGIIQQMQKFIFPDKATNIKTDNDRYGNTVVTYDLQVREGGLGIGVIIGFIFILLGSLWLLWVLFGKQIISIKNVPAQNSDEKKLEEVVSKEFK